MKSIKEQVLEYVERSGVVRSRDLNKLAMPACYLNVLEQEGKIQKLSRGLYASIEYEFDERQSYIEICKRVPHATLCLLSALNFYDMTTQNPYQVWIAVNRRAKHPKIDYPPIRVMRFSGKALTEGIETVTQQGSEIRVYCAAKTVADCFKYRNKIGTDVALEALRDGLSKKLFTLKELHYYAQICRVQKVMKPYIEAVC